MSRDQNNILSDSICGLTLAVAGLSHEINNDKNRAILCRLAEMENRIMSAISDYTGRVDAAFTTIGDSVDSIVSSQSGITADVASLKDIILKLQNNPGPISPEDQVLLDQGEAKITGIATKTAAVATALAALDAETENPPAPPA